jgi:hypothetical protein
MTTRSDLIFDVEMSVRYHRRRAAFLERAGMLMTLTTLIGGASAFVSLAGTEGTLIAKVAALVITAVGVLQSVYRVDACAAQHRQWLSEWLALLSEIHINAEPTPTLLNGWINRRYDIEKECVCEMRALQVDCYNRTMRALDREGSPIPLSGPQRWLMQVHSFENGFEAVTSI